MTKLKTLKEIRWECSDKGEVNYKLKAEAVKWVKSEKLLFMSDTIDWIKHFFNITEEDLK